MRLNEHERDSIRQILFSHFGGDSKIWLFGSRVDDEQKGGDIDLMVEPSNRNIPNSVQLNCRAVAELQIALGDQKIDLIIKLPGRENTRIYQIARKSGVCL